jgi:molybdate transport system permease protein
VASLSTAITFAVGVWAANAISRLPKTVKGLIDCALTLPMVLPPTVVGFLLLLVLGPKGPVGAWLLSSWGIRVVMTWYAAIFATVVVTFPLMYRVARGAFESMNHAPLYAGRNLGLSKTWLFWHVTLPECLPGLLAGTVLAFARALGEYGATTMLTGYIPGRTATISTTVYQLWREGNDALALKWVLINIAISFCTLVTINLLEQKNERTLLYK